MRIKDRLTALFAATAVLISSVSALSAVYAYNPDEGMINVTFDDNNHGFVGSMGGSVTVSNGYMHINPFSDGIEAFAKHSINTPPNVDAEVELDFKQNSKKLDGTCVLSLSHDGIDLVRIETVDGDIAMKKRGSTRYTVLVDNYSANRWYKINVKTNFNLKTVDVMIDGVLKAQEEALLTDDNVIDELYVATKYSPGFFIDNVKIFVKPNVSNITLTGTENPLVRTGKQSVYEYSAAVYDEAGGVLEGAVSFGLKTSLGSVIPLDANTIEEYGAKIERKGDTAIVTFGDNAAGKTYTLTATAGDETISKTLTVA